jgi:AcrR family transcriptional regulator
MATASKVLTELRLQGLVRAEPGVGTVVVAPPARRARTPQPHRPSMQELVVRAAVQIADTEGLAALSMRRLSGELGVPTMSLYRHVADKEELILLMMDRVFAGNPPPDPPPDGWRARLEALCRLQWQMYRRHPWLAQAVSFTRPLLAPNAMAHTEWAMAALDDRGLDEHATFIAAVTVANYLRGTAVGLEAEAQAEQDSGLTEAQWMSGQEARFAEVMASGRFPMLARYLTREPDFDLDQLMEFGLQRLLDGLARLMPAD